MKNILVYFLENKVEPSITDFLNYLYDYYRLDRTQILKFFLEDFKKMYFGQNFFY